MKSSTPHLPTLTLFLLTPGPNLTQLPNHTKSAKNLPVFYSSLFSPLLPLPLFPSNNITPRDTLKHPLYANLPGRYHRPLHFSISLLYKKVVVVQKKISKSPKKKSPGISSWVKPILIFLFRHINSVLESGPGTSLQVHIRV